MTLFVHLKEVGGMVLKGNAVALPCHLEPRVILVDGNTAKLLDLACGKTCVIVRQKRREGILGGQSMRASALVLPVDIQV